MQQIYDKRAGQFKGPSGSTRIPKTENFRCSNAVVEFLNAFRKDLQQIPAGKNADIAGSVLLRLIKAENPEGERNRYTEEQLDRASARLNGVLTEWDWAERADVKQLYLGRQMIARRLGFTSLHCLFTSEHSSSRSQDDYENGEHDLLKPLTTTLERLVRAQALGDERLWETTVADVLRFAHVRGLCPISERLERALTRTPRAETYDESVHGAERGDWLADGFFRMSLEEISRRQVSANSD